MNPHPIKDTLLKRARMPIPPPQRLKTVNSKTSKNSEQINKEQQAKTKEYSPKASLEFILSACGEFNRTMSKDHPSA